MFVVLFLSQGGMKAVLWTDVFQVCVMVIGFIAMIIGVSVHLGGLDKAWKVADEGGRIDFFEYGENKLISILRGMSVQMAIICFIIFLFLNAFFNNG